MKQCSLPTVVAFSIAASVGAFAWSTAAPAVKVMSRDQIAAEIIGKPLSGKRFGMKVHMIFRADGLVEITTSFMSNRGRWKYNAAGICTIMESGPRKGEHCITFEHVGTGRFHTSEGVTLSVEPR